jgi:hypothetical protein
MIVMVVTCIFAHSGEFHLQPLYNRKATQGGGEGGENPLQDFR